MLATYRFDWWAHRARELAIAMLLTGGVITLSQHMTTYRRGLIPASTWFVVNEIYVPDHAQGSNPELIYDREIREEFTGFWIVEVQREMADGLWAVACTGDGVNEYQPGNVLPSAEGSPHNTVDWEWMLGKPCIVSPGVYRLRATYELARIGWPTKSLFRLSNVFVIT